MSFINTEWSVLFCVYLLREAQRLSDMIRTGGCQERVRRLAFPAERLHMQNVLRMHVGYAHQARALTVCAAPISHCRLRMSNCITIAHLAGN